MFTRALGAGVVGVCVSLLGCSDNGTEQSAAGGATTVAAGGGAEAGASSAGHAGSSVGGSGGASVSSAGASAGGVSGSGGVSATAGSSGAPGSSGNAGAGVAGGTGGANAGGTAGTGGASAQAGGGAGGAGNQPSCVPDGSGSITMKFSGSAPFDETRANDYTCLGTFSSAAAAAGLILRVDNPEPNPAGVVFANLPKFSAGDVGNIAFDELTFALAPGGVWSDPSSSTPDTKHCTFNVTANQALTGMPNIYRVTGSISCNAALPGLPDAMTIQKLQFVTMFSPAE
jgi:hypothetical protein